MDLSVWIAQMREAMGRTQAQLQVVAGDGVTGSDTGLVMTSLRTKLCMLVAGQLDESESDGIFEAMKFISRYLEPLAGIESKLQHPEKTGAARLLAQLDQLLAAESNGPPLPVREFETDYDPDIEE